jgi:hypothetical protein
MSVEDYRANYNRAKGEAATRAADPTDPLAGGLAGDGDAVRGSRTDQEVIASFADTGADTSARVAAIDKARLDALSRPGVMRALITVLADQADDARVRSAAQGALDELSFAVADFAPYEADYRGALRIAATDPDSQLAERALEVLALHRDEYAHRLLVQGLEDPSTAVVSRLRALQFLGYDLHAGHYPVLRRIVEEAGDPHERIAALRLLAADSGSAAVLERIVADRSEDVQARTVSAVALNAQNPDAFASKAREIVLDPEEDDDLRAISLTALTVVPEVTDGPDLAEAVMSTPIPPSPELERAAQQYREAKSR